MSLHHSRPSDLSLLSLWLFQRWTLETRGTFLVGQMEIVVGRMVSATVSALVVPVSSRRNTVMNLFEYSFFYPMKVSSRASVHALSMRT